MAEIIRGGPGLGLRDRLHGSPSTGSDEGIEGMPTEDFDPFLGENEDATGKEAGPPPPESQ